MSALILPRRFTSQPQYAAPIDWSNPLTRGLSALLLPSAGLRDIVTGQTWAPFGAAPTLSPGQYGIAVDSTAAFGGLVLSPAQNIATAAQTHLVLIDYRSISQQYAGILVSASADGSAASLSLQEAGGYFTVYPTATSLVSTAPFGPSLIIFSGDATDSSAYKDGISILASGPAVAAQINSRLVLFGERTASATYAVKGLAYIEASWTRRLSIPEQDSVSRNVWQLLKAPPRRLWVAGASGGAYSVAIAEAGVAADAPAASAKFSGAQSEAGSAAETLSVSIVAPVALAESGVAVDAPASAFVAPVAVAESGAAADTTNFGASVASVAVAEAGAGADAVSATAVLAPAQVEAGVASDSPTAKFIAPVAQSEAGAAFDSPAAVSVAPVATAESGAAADTVAAGGIVSGAAVAEAGTAVDAATSQAAFAATQAETGVAGDLPAATIITPASVADSGAAADATNFSGTTFSSAVTEAGASADTITAAAMLAAAVAEAAASADASSVQAALTAAMPETAAAADAPSALAITASSLVESGNALDASDAVVAGTAGGAAVWSYTLANGMTAGNTLLAVYSMLTDLHDIHGLRIGSPLTVSTAQRAAAAIVQSISEAAGTVTVSRTA